jgi:hypothetical protein
MAAEAGNSLDWDVRTVSEEVVKFKSKIRMAKMN